MKSFDPSTLRALRLRGSCPSTTLWEQRTMTKVPGRLLYIQKFPQKFKKSANKETKKL